MKIDINLKNFNDFEMIYYFSSFIIFLHFKIIEIFWTITNQFSQTFMRKFPLVIHITYLKISEIFWTITKGDMVGLLMGLDWS